MDRAFVIRIATLYLPVCLTAMAWALRRPGPRARLGLLLGFAWNAATLPVLQLAAEQASWWSFADTDAQYFGMPIEAYLGWAVLWGVLPQLAFRGQRPEVVVGVLAIADLLLMPEMEPVLTLDEGWIAGEAIGLLLCVLPA